MADPVAPLTTPQQIRIAAMAGVIPCEQQVFITFGEDIGYGPAWVVYGAGWQDRWPIPENRSKSRQLQGAQAVARIRCGVTSWRKNALGDYVAEVDRRFPIVKQGNSLKELRKEARR